ncbi:MAG: WecB/TagA/CpsF family glycosyltransferase [Pseudomonadota bacterium]
MNWIKADMSAQHALLRVTVPTQAALMADISARLGAGQGFSIATLNLDHVLKLRQQPAFRDAYLAQTHVTADGNPIVWFSRLAGEDVSLVPGSELIIPVIEAAIARDVPIAMFGASQASLDATAAALEARYGADRIKIAAKIAPPMGFDPTSAEADAYIAELGASGAGVCFLALGAPKQEIFASRAQDKLPHMGFLSIGAGLDFISGHQTRAPYLVRRLALEWLWRLALSPKRLMGRYMGCFGLLPGLLGSALKARRLRAKAAP